MRAGFEFQALRAGQVSVAVDAGGRAHARRSVRAADGSLVWENLDCAGMPASAAIAAVSVLRADGSEPQLRTRAFASDRQLLQLIAHRASILALAGADDVHLIAKQAIDDVRAAVAGHSIAFALERLPRLGLDVGYSADRHALQLAINLAEFSGRASLLDHLIIEPCARAGAAHARTWLKAFATPRMLNDLSELAAVDVLARQLLSYQCQNNDRAQRTEAS